ncbi:MAG: PIN domain-containing protein [Candidatus Competibacteraceae bacterium]|nr:PIN domain-containing protein [Candidatus Competibacteraceae bacterium]
MPGEFLDTNILVYAFSTDRRSASATAIMARGGTISVQCLNEFVNVARRKLRMEWREIHQALVAIRSFCRCIPLDLEIHSAALALAERHGFSIFDAVIVASALASDCDVLLTEDMQHGQIVNGQLRLVNPFLPG